MRGSPGRKTEDRMTNETRRRNRASRSLARSAARITIARELRRKATEAETVAWRLLCELRPKGFRFRRQHPIGKCVVDFCCVQKRLIVEVDGSVHAQPSQAARDARRDHYLERFGYTILRFPNGIVLDAPDEFVRRILNLVWSLPESARRQATSGPSVTPSPPAPLPQRGEGSEGWRG